jgi:SAM-dependent MidA family methyltransferase
MRPGQKDITAHADWTAVREAGRRAGLEMVGPRPQRQVLLSLGIAEVDAALQNDHRRALAARKGAVAVESLSRRQALRALIDEAGLGRLGVMAGLADIARPPFLR